MSEEYENEVEEMGEELSAEELFEQHRLEIEERFAEKGFFKRLIDMFIGLSKPRGSREYKIATVELQRLAAPLLAILLPTLGIIVLIVITAVTGQSKEVIQIEVARAQDEQEELTEESEPEPEVEPETPPDEMIDVMIDTPSVEPVSDMSAPTPAPSNEPVSVKPATQDSVSIIKSPVTMKSMTGSRTPGSIGAMTRGGANYGDAATEAAVMKALRWLKKTQRPDGSWDGDAKSFQHSATAATGYALLTFMAHGETPTSPEFGATVKKAIDYLVNTQIQAKNFDGETVWTYPDAHKSNGAYPFAIATYALCEAYGMTKNPNVREAATRSLERIIKHQTPTGGWNYYYCVDANTPGTGIGGKPDDLSFGGWTAQALKAGKLAGIHVDGMEECIKKMINCLKKRNYDKTVGFAYRPDAESRAHESHGLAGKGCLALQFFGCAKDPEVRNALNVMKDWVPTFEMDVHPHPGKYWNSPQYYYYYATQCKYQAGMAQGASPDDQQRWQKWNAEMKAYYPKQIKDDGEIPGVDGKPKKCGYWVNKDVPNHTIRPVMDTCLVALQLMVYYRYLPTSQSKASDTDAGKKKKAKKEEVEVEVDI